MTLSDEGVETSAEARTPGLLVQAGLVVAIVAELWLRRTVMKFVALLTVLAVPAAAFSVDSPAWTSFGVLAGLAAAVVMAVDLRRHRSPSRNWLTMLTVAAFDVSVILVLLLT